MLVQVSGYLSTNFENDHDGEWEDWLNITSRLKDNQSHRKTPFSIKIII